MAVNKKANEYQPGKDDLGKIIAEIRSDIETTGKKPLLYDEKNFNDRANAIDFLEFHVIDRIEGILSDSNPPGELFPLKQEAEGLKCKLEAINERVFQRLRADIRLGDCKGKAFRGALREYFGDDFNDRRGEGKPGYDNLDIFVNGLLLIEPVPDETLTRSPEMVFYQQTPVRVILELIEKASFKTGDAFYDLGSGLGHVPVLVNLLSGIRAKGVEFEPAYCNYATACAAELNLPGVQFINADAREANYSDGTAFFMYTPFEGQMLDEVLEKLWLESQNRPIRLFTYGPCTLQVAGQTWLNREDQEENNMFKLGVFRS
ncbi:MAG TPA: class I SAM-dependent methyltransferase [Mucilaginibacter sp.]|jgi:hypothetical protein|nr:class I SAM-dependent methyltransferase [Mucilaginibacter sp.]